MNAARSFLERLAGLHRQERGLQTVELAMVLPILALLVFGAVDCGRAYFSWLIITNAARDGARVATVAAPVATISTAVQNAATGLYVTSVQTGTCSGSANGTLCVTVNNPVGTSGTAVTVNVRYNFTFLFLPKLFAWVGGPALTGGIFPLNAHATMRLE